MLAGKFFEYCREYGGSETTNSKKFENYNKLLIIIINKLIQVINNLYSYLCY